MTLPDTDDAGQHLTTKDGWRRFVAGGPKPPHIPAPAPKSYAKLPKETRLKLDDLRIDHHARLMVVATSTVRHTVTTGRRLVMLNRHAISARRGLIVSGPAGTGKTIALTQLGLAHELNDRHTHPDAHGYCGRPPRPDAEAGTSPWWCSARCRRRGDLLNKAPSSNGILPDQKQVLPCPGCGAQFIRPAISPRSACTPRCHGRNVRAQQAELALYENPNAVEDV
ncbi:hypothetical protein ACFRQM_24655 [Streptomyces sp. NPDC056831]|uniref:hypothetical protein n=1 Tax=Streptomyces sp. NPDC056831 TaxID=3345954 RepID=UPI00369ADABE